MIKANGQSSGPRSTLPGFRASRLSYLSRIRSLASTTTTNTTTPPPTNHTTTPPTASHNRQDSTGGLHWQQTSDHLKEQRSKVNDQSQVSRLKVKGPGHAPRFHASRLPYLSRIRSLPPPAGHNRQDSTGACTGKRQQTIYHLNGQ